MQQATATKLISLIGAMLDRDKHISEHRLNVAEHDVRGLDVIALERTEDKYERQMAMAMKTSLDDVAAALTKDIAGEAVS